jgi:acyl-CoA dehydrogenase
VAEGVPGAALADLFVISVPAGGVIVLPRDLVQVDPVVGSLGGREAAIADVRLDVSVLTGSPAVPDGQIQRDLDLWDAVVAVAGARAALELTLSYVAERKVFGRPVAEFENTRFRLAEIAAEIEAAEAFTDSCVSALGQELLEPATAAAARLIAERVHDHATDQGMQFHGGYGYMREYPISHAFGDARFLRLSAASNDPRESLAAALNL